jgi:hypothetical protein
MRNPIADSEYYFQKAHQYALETGDYAYAGYTSFFILSLISVVKPYNQVLSEGKQRIEFLRSCMFEFAVISL